MEWDWVFVCQALACGFAMGFLISFSGVGGGVLVIPAISFGFDLPVSVAVGTASAYTALTKIFAGIEHTRRGNVNFRLFWLFIIGAAPGAMLAAAAINLVLHLNPDSHDAVQSVLRFLVASAILLSLIFVLTQSREKELSEQHAGAVGATGLGIGAIMGATGIGGGVLIAPALLTCGEQPKRVVGTSILIALALSAIAAFIYAGGGQVRYDLTLWMLAGSLVAVPVGGIVLNRVSETFVRRSLVVLVALALGLMLIG